MEKQTHFSLTEKKKDVSMGTTGAWIPLSHAVTAVLIWFHYRNPVMITYPFNPRLQYVGGYNVENLRSEFIGNEIGGGFLPGVMCDTMYERVGPLSFFSSLCLIA